MTKKRYQTCMIVVRGLTLSLTFCSSSFPYPFCRSASTLKGSFAQANSRLAGGHCVLEAGRPPGISASPGIDARRAYGIGLRDSRQLKRSLLIMSRQLDMGAQGRGRVHPVLQEGTSVGPLGCNETET